MDNVYNLAILEALFKDYLLAGKLSRVSTKNYLSDIKHYLSWFYIYVKPKTLALDLKQINYTYLDLFIVESTEDLVKSYKSYLTDSNIPLKTINRRLSAIRSFYAFTIERGYMNLNPTVSIRNVVLTSTNLQNEPIDDSSMLDNIKMYLSDNLEAGKKEKTIKDMYEFFDMWNS